LAIKPDLAEALLNRGHLLRELRRFEEALDSYDRARAAAPTMSTYCTIAPRSSPICSATTTHSRATTPL